MSRKQYIALAFDKPLALSNFFICPVPYPQDKTALNNSPPRQEGLELPWELLGGE